VKPPRQTDPRTGRPLDASGRAALSDLSDRELEAELTTAAEAPACQRFDRFAELLRERARRRAVAA
jgi:hypothetical protein